MERLGRTANFARRHPFLGIATVGAVAAGSFGAVKYPGEIVAVTKAVYNHIFTDYDLPPESSDATVGTTGYVCFYENPNCDENSAAAGKIGPLASIYSGGNSIPLEVKPGTYENIVNAIVDKEDDEFFTRKGFDYQSFLRAFIANLKAGRIVQGGSTISDTLVTNDFIRSTPAYKKHERCVENLRGKPEADKTQLEIEHPEQAIKKCSVLTDPEKIDEKSYEIEIAEKLDSIYTTDKDPATGKYLGKYVILEKLMNTAYFGEGAYGVGAASIVYFGITADKLNPLQSATIAAKMRSPDNFDGDFDPVDNFTERSKLFYQRNIVLDAMVRNHHLDPAERDRLKYVQLDDPVESGLLPYQIFPQGISIDYTVADIIGARHYLDNVLNQVKTSIKNAGQPESFLYQGLDINTTLSFPLQEATREAIEGSEWPRDGRQVAAVVLRHDGSVAAEYGANYKDTQIDMLEVPAHVGSALKPLILAQAMMSGRVTDLSVPYPLQAIDFNIYPAKTAIVWPNGDNGKDWTPQGGHLCRNEAEWNIEKALWLSCNDTFLNIALDGAPDSLTGLRQLMTDFYAPSAQADAKPSWVLGQADITRMGLANIYNGLWGNSGLSMPDGRINDITIATKDGFKQLIDYRIERAQAQPSKQIVPPEIAQKIAEAAGGVIAYGTASRELQDMSSCTVGKTGTETENKTANFVGTTLTADGNYTAVVEESYVDGNDSLGGDEEGGHLPARIYGIIMRPIAVDGCVSAK